MLWLKLIAFLKAQLTIKKNLKTFKKYFLNSDFAQDRAVIYCFPGSENP